MREPARVLTRTMSNGLQGVADAAQFFLHLVRADDVAVRQRAEVELDAGAEEPVERHLVDGDHAVAVDVLRLEVIGRIHVGAVVGGELHLLEGPAFAVRQVVGLEAGEALEQHPAFCLPVR